jgi:hypothetical protein
MSFSRMACRAKPSDGNRARVFEGAEMNDTVFID